MDNIFDSTKHSWIIYLIQVKLLWTKGYNFLLGRVYFTGVDEYRKLLDFAPIFNSLTWDSNKKSTNCMPNGIWPKKLSHLMLILPQSWII